MGLQKCERKKLVAGVDYKGSSCFKEDEGPRASVGFSISVCVGLAGDALP